MDATSHLVRMAEELKCPICLSLLKSSVSLTCNHIFCNVCIDKSMKSDSTCPVCKIPYRRREIRPAPHMDTLVSIYKGMEVSSGVNILITQSERQSPDLENQVEAENDGKSKTISKACVSTPKTQNPRKTKAKTSKGPAKKTKRCNSDPVGPSFPIKKRIQVPQHHPQETPTRPANPEGKKNELIKDVTQTNVSMPEAAARLEENEETMFTPFFWLRDEEDAEKTTQFTPLDPVNGSPPDGPCFSDIKDSDDDETCHLASKDVNMFDSEMFEWTQRPCSPELCSSPMKMQDKESDRVGETENGDNMNVDMEADKLVVDLPTDTKVKGSKKRAKKRGESVQKKRVKKDTNKVVENSTEPLEADQDKGSNINGLVKCKKQNRGRGKKVSDVATELNGTTSKHGDGSAVLEGSGDIHTANIVDENQKEITNQPSIKRTKRSKKQDLGNSNISNVPSEPSAVYGKTKACGSRKQIEKGQASKVKTSKKVAFTINENVTVKSVDNIPSSERVALKESRPLGEVQCSSGTASNSKGKSNPNPNPNPNTLILHKCAFCQSTEESDISGCMTHYLKGKPLPLDHESVLSAIHAHRNCTEWAPNVYFEDDIAVNLDAELARSKRIKCSCCGLKGAALGCFEKSCRRSFHFTCAKPTPQCRWDEDNFVMLCPFHASQKLPNETCNSQQKEKKQYVPKKQPNAKESQAPIVDTTSLISRWDSHGLFSKIVICCSALTSNEKETVIKFEKLSGVTMLKTWDSKVTHVIASVDENGASRRTLKYLMGILEGKWILNIEWIKACLEVKKPVDEQLYEINLDIHGLTGGPKLGRFRLLNKEPKLFNGYKFYFTGDFATSYKGYLQDLIIAAGGTMLHRKPVPAQNEMQFLIFNQELPDKYKASEQSLILSKRKSEAQVIANSCGAVAVSNSWILNSISACKLQSLD